VTEAEAVAALKRGDEQGLADLVARFEGRALRVAAVMLRDPSLAEDIVSQAFLKAFRSRDRLDPAMVFWPWLLTIVVNEARTELRRRSIRERLFQTLRRRPATELDPAVQAELNELGRWLLSAIASLPRVEREVVQLRFLLDMDEVSIAQAVGCPVGTVKTRIYRGRRRIQRLATRELVDYLPARLLIGAPHD